MARSYRTLLLTAVTGLASLSVCGIAAANDRTDALDARHKACLEQIGQDMDLAFEEAMIWRDQGGGRRARHCEAMALFALGHEAEAARRLDELADGRDGGSDQMRLNFRAEAANFWLAAEEPDQAILSATSGLAYDEDNADLRIIRARAETMKGQIEAAEDELDAIIAKSPEHAEALRYRADVKMRQGRLDAALVDIEMSLMADPDSVETALLRGRIKEAIRLFEITAEPEIIKPQ